MRKYLFFFIFLLCFCNIFAQDITKLNFIFEKILKEENDSAKNILNDSIKTVLEVFFEDGEKFFADFKQIKYIGKISSKDNLVNVYTWNIPLANSMHFNCFIQQKDGKIFYFSQNNCYKPKENQTVTQNNWYGALYYQIVPFKRNKKTLYALAGLGQYRSSTKIKILDVLDLQNSEPQFGLPVFFKDDKTALQRIVFEYDANSAMYLEYNEKRKRFEFDHLSPMRIENDEVISFGPDMSIDGYRQSGGNWKFVEDLNVKNRIKR